MSGRTAAARTALGLGWRAAPMALLGVIAIAAVSALLPVLAAWLTKLVIDRLTGPHSGAPAVGGLAVGLAVVGVATVILPHLQQLVRGELAREVGLLAQDRLYAAVNGYAGLGRFEDPAHLDRLRLAQQCGQDAPPQLIETAVGVLRTTVTVTGFVVALTLVSPWMAAIVVIGALPTLIAELRLAGLRVDAAVRVTPLERREMFYARLLGSVEAAKEIRLFGTGDHLRQRMRADRQAINAVNRGLAYRTVAVQGTPALISAAIAASGLIWAVTATAGGTLTVGDITMFVAGVAAVQGGLTTIAVAAAIAHQHLLLFGHYVAVVTAPPDLPALAPAHPAQPLRHRIELRDVWFRYSDQHPWVLRGVNLTIGHGRSVALVGLNGAGKSTLVKLLCRYYDPTRGSVLWDGVDIRRIPVPELRRRISAIFQDFMHYDLTAAENITLGDLARADDRESIREAAVRAGIHDKLASLPQGYDTMLTRTFAGEDQDDGVVLSGGQWQRVAIARSFLRDNPDLLILDEPTAGLDAAAEYDLHTTIRRYRHDRTSLLISHRLGAIRDADQIVVMGDGVVVEQGRHDELLAAGGRYADLFLRQAAGYTLDEPIREPDSVRPRLDGIEVGS